MSELSRNIALGAAAVGAGVVIAGATMLSAPNPRSGGGNNGGGGGGATVSVTVREIHPSVSLSSPTNGDVFLSPRLSTTINFKDSQSVNLTLTSPNGTTCDLGTYYDTGSDWSSPSGANYTGDIDVSTCDGGAHGVYALTASAPGLSVSSELNFTYSVFNIRPASLDKNGDPIVFVEYGEGIGLVSFSATCNGASSKVLDDYNYVVEDNEDHIDEVLLPFKDKSVAAGTCTVSATAKKASGEPINSQSVEGATATTIITYTGLQL